MHCHDCAGGNSGAEDDQCRHLRQVYFQEMQASPQGCPCLQTFRPKLRCFCVAGAGGFTVTNGNARQVIAIRIGVVVLSPQLEKDAVAQTASVTVLPDTTGGTDDNSVAFNIPDSHFRYRVYNTVIPLRNVIWGR